MPTGTQLDLWWASGWQTGEAVALRRDLRKLGWETEIYLRDGTDSEWDTEVLEAVARRDGEEILVSGGVSMEYLHPAEVQAELASLDEELWTRVVAQVKGVGL